MPELPVRIYLPDVRERKFLHGAPGQYSERVSASIEAELRALPSGADWSADVVAVAREAVGGDPRTGDTITLYRGGFADTRTWNSRKWVKIDQWIDGQMIVSGTVRSPLLAPRSLTTDILKAEDDEGVISGEQYAFDTLRTQETMLRSFEAEHFQSTANLLVDTLQIGNGNVSFFNLNNELLSLTGERRLSIPIIPRSSRPQAFRLPSGQALADYRRDSVNDTITLQIQVQTTLEARGRRLAYTRVYYDIRAWYGTAISAAAGTETILHTWSGERTVGSQRTGTGSDSSRIYNPITRTDAEAPTNGSSPLTITLAQSPLEATRYLFFDANYFPDISQGQVINEDDGRYNVDSGGFSQVHEVSVSIIVTKQGND